MWSMFQTVARRGVRWTAMGLGKITTHEQRSKVLMNHDRRCLCNRHARWRRGFLCGGSSSRLRTWVFFIALLIALLSRLSEHESLPIHHPALLHGVLLACACNLPSSVGGLNPLCTLFLLLPLGTVFCCLRLGLL